MEVGTCIKKKCDSCGRINRSQYGLVDGDACDYCEGPLWNEYGNYANSGGEE